MAVALVQAKGNSGNTVGLVVGPGQGWAAPTVGNLLVAFANSNGTCTVPTGWTAGPSVVDGNGAYSYYKIAAAGDTTTTFGNAAQQTSVGILEYSGLTATPFDASNSATTTATGTSTPSVSDTTTVAGDLIVCMALLKMGTATTSPASPTWTNSFVNELSVVQASASSATASFIADLTAGAAGAYSTVCSWTNTITDRQALILAFKPAAGGVAKSGTATGSTATGGTEVGTAQRKGTGTGATVTGDTFLGTAQRRGTGTGATATGGSEVGRAQKRGTGTTGATVSSDTEVGVGQRRGTIGGVTAANGTETGAAQRRGTSGAPTLATGTATGTAQRKGTGTGSTVTAGAATAAPPVAAPPPGGGGNSSGRTFWIGQMPAPRILTRTGAAKTGHTGSRGSCLAGKAARHGAAAGTTTGVTTVTPTAHLHGQARTGMLRSRCHLTGHPTFYDTQQEEDLLILMLTH